MNQIDDNLVKYYPLMIIFVIALVLGYFYNSLSIAFCIICFGYGLFIKDIKKTIVLSIILCIIYGLFLNYYVFFLPQYYISYFYFSTYYIDYNIVSSIGFFVYDFIINFISSIIGVGTRLVFDKNRVKNPLVYPNNTINHFNDESIAFCSNCGARVSKDSQFCQKCGSKIE